MEIASGIWLEDVLIALSGICLLTGLFLLVSKGKSITLGLALLAVSIVLWLSGGFMGGLDVGYQAQQSKRLKNQFTGITDLLNKLNSN